MSEGEDRRLARKARRRQARREAILDAAFDLVQREGLGALSTAALAEAADLAPATLYHYVDSLDHVREAIAVRAIDQEAAVMVAACQAAPDGVSALEAMLRARVDFYLDRPEAFALVSEAFSGVHLRPEVFQTGIYPASRRVNDPLEARLLAEQAEGLVSSAVQPRRLANVAFCAAHGILAVTLGIGRMGGEMRFATQQLVDEACLALRRACAPSGTTGQGRGGEG